MTPFDLALEKELDVEAQRFNNKWLFVWYNINIEHRVVDLEDFQGGHFHIGGIFEGQVQPKYWEAISRYLSGKIVEFFRKWDDETRQYPPELRKSSLKQTAIACRRFVAWIIRRATETDRALRGSGDPNSVEPYNSSGYHTEANAEIFLLEEAHEKLIEGQTPKSPAPPPKLRDGIEKFYAENKGMVWLIGAILSGLALAYKLFVG
jgi:hypothetical protein